MDLERLCVVQFDRRKGLGQAPASFDRGALFLETCQRLAWIGDRERLTQNTRTAANEDATGVAFEIYTGAQAYRFLLRVCCGLESEIQGETDIFGQVKSAWASYAGSDRRILGPIFQSLFEDTKSIRTQYLQGIGGNSYGSLVRRLLDLRSDSSLLILGAGQLTQSVIPYLQSARKITLWNRSEERLQAMKKWAHSTLHGPLEAVDWKTFDRLLVCIPHGTEFDSILLSHWSALSSDPQARVAVHLGLYREEAPVFASAGFTCLNELFELQNAQKEVRSLRIAEALRVIDERYRIRQKEAV